MHFLAAVASKETEGCGSQQPQAMKRSSNQRRSMAVKVIDGLFSAAFNSSGFIASNYGSNCRK
jgi:hypothetical protein